MLIMLYMLQHRHNVKVCATVIFMVVCWCVYMLGVCQQGSLCLSCKHNVL